MYRRGLTRGQIASLARAAPATVGYHLGLARTMDPGLQREHEAASRKPVRLTAHGAERIQQLVSFLQETGGYPSRSSDDVSERTLAEWLQRRRREAADGTLAPALYKGLSGLPGWRGTPRAAADEARWQELLAALAVYRASGQDCRATRPASLAKSMSSVSGCTPSGPGSAEANSSPPRRRLWTPPSRAGGPEERAAGNPDPRTGCAYWGPGGAFSFVGACHPAP